MVDSKRWVVVGYGGQCLNCGQYNIPKIIHSVTTLNNLPMCVSYCFEDYSQQICKHNCSLDIVNDQSPTLIYQ